ncbi:MAG: CinA family protein [Anaerolineae bacterium]|nr:CinA family protein [Anaerolineae bacterium]
MTEKLEIIVGTLLRAQNKTIGTAESCTGGLVAHLLTNISGSSAYVLGGVVAYANAIKQHVLGVKEETLIHYGAVSEAVAGEMALGAIRILGVDVALSITGIAGPSGGTPEKPVGLVYIGLADKNGLYTVERHVWSYDREGNKQASASAALDLVIKYLRQ